MEPTNKLAGEAGVTAIEDNVTVGVVVSVVVITVVVVDVVVGVVVVVVVVVVVGTAIFTERFSVFGPPPAAKIAVTAAIAVPLELFTWKVMVAPFGISP